jgi:ankyrin repeat protein
VGGRTALLEVTKGGIGEVVKILLDSGADVDISGKSKSAINFVIRFGNPNMVSLLLESGPNIRSKQEPECISKYTVEKNKYCSEELASDFERIVNLLDA